MDWAFTGNDIFTGTCAMREGTVVVSDFNGQEYSIDVELGRGRIVKAG
jgi:hypothetical protein